MNHGITHNVLDATGLGSGIGDFVEEYVFPGGQLAHVANVIDAMARKGLELVDAEALREHYAKTLGCWLDGLESNAEAARSLVGEEKFRVWRVYLAGSAHAAAGEQRLVVSGNDALRATVSGQDFVWAKMPFEECANRRGVVRVDRVRRGADGRPQHAAILATLAMRGAESGDEFLQYNKMGLEFRGQVATGLSSVCGNFLRRSAKPDAAASK